MKKFSDFATGSTTFIGDKVKIDDILGKEIVIKGFKVTDSKYKNTQMLTLQIELNNVERIIFTGSQVLIEQCEKYKDEMPFMTKIERIDKFFTFS